MPEMKEVTPEQYAKALEKHKQEVYHFALQGWQMPLLHGLIALAADHPAISKLGWPTKDFISQVRWWCREKFSKWGFSLEEVEYLDKMREHAQGEETLTPATMIKKRGKHRIYSW